MKMGSQSEIKLRGKLWSLHTRSMKSYATVWAVKWVGSVPKWAPLEKRSTMVIITVAPLKFGRLVMKSRAKSSHDCDGGGTGWRRPAGFWWTYLVCKQSVHCLMNCWVSCHIPSQKKFCLMRLRVLAKTMWLPNGDLWYSSRSRGIKELLQLIQMCPLWKRRMSLISNSGCCWGSSRTQVMVDWNSSEADNSVIKSLRNLKCGTQNEKSFRHWGSLM